VAFRSHTKLRSGTVQALALSVPNLRRQLVPGSLSALRAKLTVVLRISVCASHRPKCDGQTYRGAGCFLRDAQCSAKRL